MLFTEGFATGLRAALTGWWFYTGTGGAVQSAVKHVDVNGRGSGYALQISAGDSTYTSNTFGVGDRWVHVAFRFTGIAAASVITFNRNGVANFTVDVTSTGTIELRRGSTAGTLLTSSVAGLVSPNVWYWFWIDMVCDPVAGQCTVYLNGNTTNVVQTAVTNTAATGTAGFDSFSWNHTGGGGTLYVTDIVSYTNAEKVAEFGATYPELFIPGVVGTTYDTNTSVSGAIADISEIPWASAAFNGFDATAQEVIVNNTGLSWVPPSVHGVAVVPFIERDGNILTYKIRLKSGAADVTSADVNGIGAAQFAERQVPFQQNPNGPIPWTWAAVMASKFGVKTV